MSPPWQWPGVREMNGPKAGGASDHRLLSPLALAPVAPSGLIRGCFVGRYSRVCVVSLKLAHGLGIGADSLNGPTRLPVALPPPGSRDRRPLLHKRLNRGYFAAHGSVGSAVRGVPGSRAGEVGGPPAMNQSTRAPDGLQAPMVMKMKHWVVPGWSDGSTGVALVLVGQVGGGGL